MNGVAGFRRFGAQRSAWLGLLFGISSLAACSSSDSGSPAQPNGGSPSVAGSSGAPPVGAAGAPSIAGSAAAGAVDVAGSPAAGGDLGAAGTAPSGGAGPSGGSGGAPSSAGSTGAGTKLAVCDFSSGLNVAWVNFAGDIPNPNLNTFNTIFKNTHDAGGRVIRWWYHTNGTVTPGYGSDGKSQAIQQSHIDGVKAILKAANDAGVAIVISLWSFDMLQENAGNAYTNNQALLEKDDNRQAYIDKYLTPLVTAIKGTKGLYAWEIFNEPEGMGPNGWATHRTTLAAIQKSVNWMASAIRTADPNALVTTSAVTFDYCSKIGGKQNLYSDDALRSVGGKQNGTLDFYEVHYYTQNGISDSAFKHPASYWGLDKKLVMGEFAPIDTDGVKANDLSKYLYENGYSGAWLWSYDADWKWPAEQGPLQALYSAHADVANCPKPQVSAAVSAATLPHPDLTSTAPRTLPSIAEVSVDVAVAAAHIRALAAAGNSMQARGEAEDLVNRYPDSATVREIENFTGAHRHRNLRSLPNGQLVFE